LHNVQRGIFVPHVVERTLEGTLFHAFEEVREFGFGTQGCRIREVDGQGVEGTNYVIARASPSITRGPLKMVT
jgi:hypothetical protein